MCVTCEEGPSVDSSRPARTIVPGEGGAGDRLKPQEGEGESPCGPGPSYTAATLGTRRNYGGDQCGFLASGPRWSRDPFCGDGAEGGHRAGVPRTTAQGGPWYLALAGTHCPSDHTPGCPVLEIFRRKTVSSPDLFSRLIKCCFL